jgi:hypothetical protein
MPLIDCTLDITLDISKVSPGSGESWIYGDPVIDWGDGTSTENVAGVTISHAYQTVGNYSIRLEGESGCGESCFHIEHVIRTLNPSNKRVSELAPTSVKIAWDNVAGNDGYAWELYKGGTPIDSGETTNTYTTLYNLEPSTSYTMYISTVVGTTYSVDYCDNSEFYFTTPSEVCDLPVCNFTATSA